MTTLQSLAPKLQDVLSSLSEHGRQHLNEVETDLTQTNVLLKEAIAKLASSFMAIHAAVMAQQQIVDALLTQAQANDAGIQALRENAAEIGLHVNAAVTGLQFQDMTDQLITRTMQRVVGFRDVLEVLCVGSDGLASQEKDDTILAVLDRMKATLEEESVSLEMALRKAVRQTHMESGDIELF